MTANTDTLLIKRTTPYGIQLEDGTYRNTNKAVQDFLKGKTPCEVEVTDTSNKGEIVKVHILHQSEPIVTDKMRERAYAERPNNLKEVRYLVDAGNTLNLATQLVVAKVYPTLSEANTALIKEFLYGAECFKIEQIVQRQ